MNDGPLSYKIIASYLTEMTARISAATKVQETTGTCTAVDPKSDVHLVADGTGGLPLNGFVCYDKALIQEEYLTCPEVSAPVTASSDDAIAPDDPSSSDDAETPAAAPTTDTAPTPSSPSMPTPTTGTEGGGSTTSGANRLRDCLKLIAMIMGYLFVV